MIFVGVGMGGRDLVGILLRDLGNFHLSLLSVVSISISISTFWALSLLSSLPFPCFLAFVLSFFPVPLL